MMFSKLDERIDDWKKIDDDPVRPELRLTWRHSVGPIFYRGSLDDPEAIVCTALLPGIPKSVQHLVDLKYTRQEETVVCAYTVWSYKPRGGRKIIFDLRDWAIDNKYERLVTLSPQTDMAHKFHINNGAWLLRENQDTRNYEYDLLQKSFIF